MGDFPVNIAVLDLKTLKIVSRASLEGSFYGLDFSPSRERLYASGAGLESIHILDFRAGYLSGHRTLPLREVPQCGIPAGLALSADGQRLWAVNLLGQSVSPIDLGAQRTLGEIALT